MATKITASGAQTAAARRVRNLARLAAALGIADTLVMGQAALGDNPAGAAARDDWAELCEIQDGCTP